MAKPQIEEGYTKIADELLEALVGTPLLDRKCRIVLAVIRLTYGWSKKSAKISYGKLAKMTDIRREHVKKEVKKLISQNILARQKSGDNDTQILWLNKNYEIWGSGLKLAPRTAHKPSTIERLRNPKYTLEILEIGKRHTHKQKKTVCVCVSSSHSSISSLDHKEDKIPSEIKEYINILSENARSQEAYRAKLKEEYRRNKLEIDQERLKAIRKK